jgi:hypothetical protein
LDDARIQKLRRLIREVMNLQDTTRRLIADLADQLHRSKAIGRGQPEKERRKKPRTG